MERMNTNPFLRLDAVAESVKLRALQQGEVVPPQRLVTKRVRRELKLPFRMIARNFMEDKTI